nr:class I SAM-dependent methyltransferase [uncultured Sphingomonas sp.]
MQTREFTPALGSPLLTGSYDLAIRLLTREAIWRDKLLRQVAPRDGETIADVGCGTGTFALMMKQAAPGARIIGIDPDAAVLKRAAAKAKEVGLDIEWRLGFARDAAELEGQLNKAVSSLVFHQVPLLEKRNGVAAMFASVRPGGEIHIADYAHQRSKIMRSLFRLTVQLLDGRTDTQLNADGALEGILTDRTGAEVLPRSVVQTATGAISLFSVTKSLHP